MKKFFLLTQLRPTIDILNLPVLKSHGAFHDPWVVMERHGTKENFPCNFCLFSMSVFRWACIKTPWCRSPCNNTKPMDNFTMVKQRAESVAYVKVSLTDDYEACFRGIRTEAEPNPLSVST